MKAVFMGTPDFALPTFEMLLKEHEVVLCVTKPDAPAGRGHKLTVPPVKELALKYNVPVYQPESSRTEEFYDRLKAAEADVFVTCAYGKILPESVLTIAPWGCVNVHASLLPEYRGAAPIWHAVMDGKRYTGVTTMLTAKGVDSGDILLCDKVEIGPDETMGQLHDVLAKVGADTLRRTLKYLPMGAIRPVPQNDALATYAPMVNKETGHIAWELSARKIHDLVRGTEPFPVAYSCLDGVRVRIRRTRVVEEDGVFAPAGTCSVHSGRLEVACGSGVVEILEIQREGARRMTAGEFLNGHTAKKFE